MTGKSLILVPFTIVVRRDETFASNGEMVSITLDEKNAEFVRGIEQVGETAFYVCKSRYDSVLQTIFPIWDELPEVVDVLSIVPGNGDGTKAVLTGWYVSAIIEESKSDD